MKNFRLEAAILAIGLILLGVFIERGIHAFAEKDRSVNVKGLAEMEVPADKVTWPLMYKNLGNDLNTLYQQIKQSNQTIVTFLKEKGIDEKEISINAPEIIDLQAERYGSNERNPYRYNVQYEYTGLNQIKPQMIEEATKNARQAAEKFAKDSDSKLGKIRHANQGQFSISDRDANTPYIKKVRVVTTIDYSLED